MPNTFDPNGRGWSDSQLLLSGVVVLVVIATCAGLLLARSKGELDQRVSVTAALTNVGDGLPDRADVKFRGVLVGAVTGVDPAVDGRPNIVHIDLKPETAQAIPSTATARVVPSNVFAVSSIELIDHGGTGHLVTGSVIGEDTALPTVLFQTTINRLRRLLVAAGGAGSDPPIGMVGLLAQATNGRGDKLLSSGARLQHILSEMNDLAATSADDPSTLTALNDMTRTLSTTTPDLLDNLQSALAPMKTLADQRQQIRNLMSGGLDTAGRAATAFTNHMDQVVGITTNLEPVIGVFAQNADKIPLIATRLTQLAQKGLDQTWNPDRQAFRANIIVSFTPLWNYIRSDCPRYGALAGPSCQTAPEARKWFDIPQVLLPGSYKPPLDLAPPPGTPLPPADLAANPVASTPDTASASAPDATPSATSVPPALTVAPSSYIGNVGPVGSAGERRQLAKVLGGQVNTAQELLLGPVARGTAVTVTTAPAQGGAR